MIIVMRGGAEPADAQAVAERLDALGYQVNPIFTIDRAVLGATGRIETDEQEAIELIRGLPGVEDVVILSRPYRMVAGDRRRARTIIDVGGIEVGGSAVTLMAGPCAVESEDQLMETARAVSQSGASILRGGAYKPSTSPYSFQGLGMPGLEMLREAARRYDLRVVTEVMDVRLVETVSAYADLLQIGTRNMQNFDLLKEVGQSRKPVLLKRGMSARLEEWLLAAEYVVSSGNPNVILCERGIRTFETHTRSTLDLSAVPALRELTHLPVIVDPSQGTGRRDLVPAMSLAAVAAGADGLLIEVHPRPDEALKDGAQSLDLEAYRDLVPRLSAVAQAVGRTLGLREPAEAERASH